ncbi:hypothetical protein C8J57DRAFT_1522067 [Mycena rebaudengoi]|nr:hypothetical protein C8J57DRAFT_1522067 [Mycena rebaudengoi]
MPNYRAAYATTPPLPFIHAAMRPHTLLLLSDPAPRFGYFSCPRAFPPIPSFTPVGAGTRGLHIAIRAKRAGGSACRLWLASLLHWCKLALHFLFCIIPSSSPLPRLARGA